MGGLDDMSDPPQGPGEERVGAGTARYAPPPQATSPASAAIVDKPRGVISPPRPRLPVIEAAPESSGDEGEIVDKDAADKIVSLVRTSMVSPLGCLSTLIVSFDHICCRLLVTSSTCTRLAEMTKSFFANVIYS